MIANQFIYGYNTEYCISLNKISHCKYTHSENFTLYLLLVCRILFNLDVPCISTSITYSYQRK